MPLTTTPSERIGRCTRMRRVFVRSNRPESFVHTRSSPGFTIITSGFEFSVHTGERTILGGIRPRGYRYLSTLCSQGARSVLQRFEGWEKKSFGRCLIEASKRFHKNVLAVALANKLARIAWSVLYHARGYDAAPTPKAA